MRVLFVNTREDAEQHPGGDNVQMQKTQESLASLGVEVIVRSPATLTALPPFDLAHLFNMQMPQAAVRLLTALQPLGTPILLSPIYWDMLAHWADTAVNTHPRWRTLAHRVGKVRAQTIYIRWQRLKEPLFRRWRDQRRLLRQAERVLPNSQAEADLLQAVFVPGKSFMQRVTVVPNGIDPTLYRELPTPSAAFVAKYGVRDFVLQVGSVNPTKNQLGLIEALYDLPVPLVFIGKPLTERMDYYAACQARGAERGNVLFLDRVAYEELPAIYALAAVHVLPSWRETPGLVSLEAAAAGCKVVTTSIGSTTDYFGDLAWYCHPGDPASVRRAVVAALQTPPSPLLRQRVLQQYTWEQAGVATLTAYQQALATRERRNAHESA